MIRLAGLLAAVVLAAAPAAVPWRPVQNERLFPERLALVLIDADALACTPCLSPLEALCRAVPPAIQRERIFGVLTFRKGKTPDSRKARIIRTKWTGYSRAVGLGFPAAVDEHHVFDFLPRETAAVIGLDCAGGIVKRWAPPFTAETVSEIAGYLLDRRSPIMEPEP